MHCWVKRAYYRGFEQHLQHIQEYDIIVDLGCGTGYLADLLSQSVKHKRIVGVDVSPEMIAFAEQNYKPMDSVQYLVQDLSQSWDSLSSELKALESKVSLIVSNFAIQFISDKSRLMHVVSKLLAKNGEFMAIYTIKPDVILMLTDEQILHNNITLADKWDPNGPEVPTYYHGIQVECYKR
ncbi:unnamed protein product [Medioppia subpectinata]|uniref:Methyltransferase domain-containing protein n=1 Tax=Medioppia subpectinata TaxID=1979941 RepID=A0A7R9PWX3_9ACAR|nr:unnamed protein product [Medioppia subpectinata]CAG2104410.1 unnamed protein product [Medioppia subpectinata]